MSRKIVTKDKVLISHTGHQEIPDMEYGVVFDGHFVRTAVHLKCDPTTAPAWSVDPLQEVISDFDSPADNPWNVVIVAMHIEARSGVTNYVISKSYILDQCVRRDPVVIANREEDCKSVLRVRPVVLEDVTVNQNALRVLQFKEVFDSPFLSGKGLISFFPRKRFEAVIETEFDIGRNEIGNKGIITAEHKILAGTLEIVVHNFVRSGAIKAPDRL